VTGARRRVRPALVLAAVAIGAILGLGIDVVRVGGLDAWLAAHGPQPLPREPPRYEARGRTVEVGGRAIYLDCRGSGSPTVILEAGFGASAGSWAWLFDDIAGTTRVCAWDRPGLGQSQARGLHTGRQAAEDLHAALAAAGERGPYVVVGHSLGGVYALLFASVEATAGGDAVAAFVLLDSFEPLIWMADDPLLDEAIRANHREVLAETGAMIQGGEQLDWAPTLAELRALPPTQAETLLLPITMGGKFGDQAQPGPAALAASWYRVVGEHYPNGRVETVENSGHVIHFDQPELVARRVPAPSSRSGWPPAPPFSTSRRGSVAPAPSRSSWSTSPASRPGSPPFSSSRTCSGSIRPRSSSSSGCSSASPARGFSCS
jgi:pimeloyl-ACP methyl ester carboxylesterase